MDVAPTKWPAVTGLVAGIILLTRLLPTTFAFDAPIHTAVALSATVGLLILALSRLLPKGDVARSHRGQHYAALPLQDVGLPRASRDPSPNLGAEDARYPSSLRKLRTYFLILVVAVCLRCEIGREIITHVQCSQMTWAPLVPLALAALDYWKVQRHRKQEVHDDPGSSAYEALENNVSTASYRYLLATFLLGLGSLVAVSTTASPASTYICPLASWWRWLVPVQQWVSTALDVIIVYCVEQLLHQMEGRGARSLSLRVMSVGWAFLFSSIVLLVLGVGYYFVSSGGQAGILTIPGLCFWSTARCIALVACTAVCALLTVHHMGILTTSLIITFVSVASTTTGYAWSNPHPFPPGSTGIGFFGICIAMLGFALYFHVQVISEEEETTTANAHHRITFRKKVPTWFYLCLLALFCVRASLWLAQSNSVSFHPIDMLIYEAQAAHESYKSRASASQSLEQAAQRYRDKYHQHPPPGFQHWYKYATDRKSVVVDEYDSIYNDMLPFYALPPTEVQRRTWETLSNPWNDASGISIRDGKAFVIGSVDSTGESMLEGVVDMISKFSEWLPDMDLAFNFNDEPRIAVPYEKIEVLRDEGRTAMSAETEKPRNSFGKDRAAQWAPLPSPSSNDTFLQDLSSQNIFYTYGSVACPPTSPARTQRIWNTKSRCTACAHPHSLGGFLSNWTLAADPCHQPDLANLHEFYLAPASFRASHELYPIFSTSKVRGFNDILYPSPCSYMDVSRGKYQPTNEYPDMPFERKENTLFWRGEISEDGGGQWEGTLRQRFVHLTSADALPQALLIPPPPRKSSKYDNETESLSEPDNGDGGSSNGSNPIKTQRGTGHSLAAHTDDVSQRGKMTYKPFPTSQLTALLSTDIQPLPSSVKSTAAESFFQAHWRYKFLLSLDGPGEEGGSFLSFLHSHSLPFRTSLKREWYDDRLTAWWHFVPLDIRGQGFWATLLYFAGIDGGEVGEPTKVGRGRQVKAHEIQGKRLADQGRQWAGKVARREDAEVYFFRLLLEWGRVVDEGREGLGFSLIEE